MKINVADIRSIDEALEKANRNFVCTDMNVSLVPVKTGRLLKIQADAVSGELFGAGLSHYQMIGARAQCVAVEGDSPELKPRVLATAFTLECLALSDQSSYSDSPGDWFITEIKTCEVDRRQVGKNKIELTDVQRILIGRNENDALYTIDGF